MASSQQTVHQKMETEEAKETAPPTSSPQQTETELEKEKETAPPTSASSALAAALRRSSSSTSSAGWAQQTEAEKESGKEKKKKEKKEKKKEKESGAQQRSAVGKGRRFPLGSPGGYPGTPEGGHRPGDSVELPGGYWAFF